MSTDDSKKSPKSLDASDILTERQVGRRGALGIIGASVVGVAAAAVTGLAQPNRAEAKVTDSDSGPNADRGGQGRGNGQTDSDSGPNADQAGAGRGNRRAPRSVSDSDSGPNSDPAGRGRSGVSDSDSGPNADRAGHGRSGR